MNLTLGFPEPAQERMLAKRTGLAGAIARFEEWMANPDLSPIGAGSMGEVYRARDPQLDRDIAIKVLPWSFVANRTACGVSRRKRGPRRL